MKQFNMVECYNDFHTYGFYAFNAAEILSKIDPDIIFSKEHPKYLPVEGLWPPYQGHTPEQAKIFRFLEEEFGKVYGFDKTSIHVCQYWTDGGERIEKWHNDACENDGSYEFALNCYFDDSDEAGRLELKPMDDDQSLFVNGYSPKKFDVVVLNHTLDFLHRVIPPKRPRRVLVITGRVLAECL